MRSRTEPSAGKWNIDRDVGTGSTLRGGLPIVEVLVQGGGEVIQRRRSAPGAFWVRTSVPLASLPVLLVRVGVLAWQPRGPELGSPKEQEMIRQ